MSFRYGKISKASFFKGGYITDSLRTDSWTNLKFSFNELNAIMTSPTMRPVLSSANTTPRSLFSQPSITSLITPSSIFPSAASTRNTSTRIKAKATSLSTCPDAVMYCAIQPDTTSAKCAEAQIPRMMDIMETA